jgi:cysteinyl-tRNA synthetase
MDFVLWKPSKPGEPAWPSPWGNGRPGWHVECSAMSAALLGETFDIHGGGIDLVFPHHENEIAQSRCAFHTDVMANYWMHNGFLQVEGEKMAKSVGNFVTIHELLQDWPGEVLRLNMLKTHYRQPIDWTLRGLEESQKILDRWYRAIGEEPPSTVYEPVVAQLRDDLNTPNGLAQLFFLESASGTSGMMAANYHSPILYSPASLLKATANLLGLLIDTASERQSKLRSALAIETSRIESLIEARSAARKAKNFKEADRIRDELAKMGVVLKDSKDGTTWEIAR